jgi:hypothetical protein
MILSLWRLPEMRNGKVSQRELDKSQRKQEVLVCENLGFPLCLWKDEFVPIVLSGGMMRLLHGTAANSL